MDAGAVYISSSWALIWATNGGTETKTNCSPDCLVAQPQATAGYWQVMKPVTTVITGEC